MHKRRSCPPATLWMLLLPWSIATTPSAVRIAVCRFTRSTHTPFGGFAAFLRPLSSRSRSIRQSDVLSSGKRRGRKSKPLVVMQLDSSRSVQPQILRDFGAPGGDSGGPGALGGLTGPSNGGEGDNDRVVPVELKTELSSSFMQYAMSTILGRALPDARDGLKPVHRRILYAMHVLGLNPEGGYRKCARVVGEVLGKYHPHGDMSVYDALVRMAQDFVMSAPLISGHGNFGSVDNDPAAAMRYTECKLSSLARDALLADISMDTVGFVPNFDGNEVEPLVLPARVPMLFLNGAAGIAVGMATNVPPHNLGELIDGLVALIDNRELSDEDLLQLIPAPDFPTGGHIMGLDGAKKLYSTGMGGVVIRAKTHMETVSIGGGRQARNAIVVTELPYQVNKAALLEKIADLVNDKKLDGIADLRDESDRDGIRVMIELKRDAVPTVVENNLFKKTQLQVSFPGNLLALSSDGKQPQRLTLREGLQTFIGFRFQTIRKRTQFELSRVEAREHIVEGLIAALDRIDDIVELVRKAKDTAAARNVLTSAEYGMSEAQTGAILSLTLGRLTALEDKKLRSERDELHGKMKVLRSLMVEDDKVYSVMKKELREIRQKHAVPRRSVITSSAAELTDMDLLANDRSVVMVTSNGYIKRMPLVEFEQQGRGTRGKAGAGRMGEDDLVMHFFACNDHDHVVFISEKGVAFAVHAFQVPLGSRTAKGVPIPQVLPLSSDDHVSSVIPLGEPIREDEYLMFLTKRGYIKKTSVAAFAKPLTSRGLIAISLEDGDALQWARRCTDAEDVLISTRHGYSMRFKAADLRPTGRTSKGCRAIKLREGDEMVDIDILSPSTKGKKYVLAITTNGYGKRIPANSFRALSRGTKGVIAIKFKAGLDDSLACMRSCAEDDEVVLTTQRGTIVRQRVEDISVQSRMGTGVTVQRLEEGNHVVSVAMVKAEQNEEEDSANTKKKKPASVPAAAEELLVADE